jgi:hypothetical protein
LTPVAKEFFFGGGTRKLELILPLTYFSSKNICEFHKMSRQIFLYQNVTKE